MTPNNNTTPVEEWEEKKLVIEVISGVEGDCVAIDGYRVAGNKPWGGGTIKQSWNTERKHIIKALELESFITLREERAREEIRKRIEQRLADCSDREYAKIGLEIALHLTANYTE